MKNRPADVVIQSTNNREQRCAFPTLVCLLAALSLTILGTACQQAQQPVSAIGPDNRGINEAALKEVDSNWSKAASAKDVDKVVSFYADDALVLQPNGPKVTAKADIRKMWSDMLTAPGFSGGWKADKVEMAGSLDLGIVTGTWEFTMNDAKGKPATDRGKFVEVFKKQADGSWKCVTDIWNSDLPLPVPATKK